MTELIDKKKLLKDLNGVKEVLAAAGDPFLANMIHRAIQCVERQPLVKQEASKPEPQFSSEDKKLEKAIRQLREAYSKAQTLDHVYNKLGWALYQTWSRYE